MENYSSCTTSPKHTVKLYNILSAASACTSILNGRNENSIPKQLEKQERFQPYFYSILCEARIQQYFTTRGAYAPILRDGTSRAILKNIRRLAPSILKENSKIRDACTERFARAVTYSTKEKGQTDTPQYPNGELEDRRRPTPILKTTEQARSQYPNG